MTGSHRPALRGLAAVTATVGLALTLAACGQEAAPVAPTPVDPAISGTATPSGAADEMALSLTTQSAWQPLHVTRSPTFPDFVVYGDGTYYGYAYSPDGRDTFRTGKLSPDELVDLVDAADELFGRDYGLPGLDGSTTTLELADAAGSDATGEVSVWVPTEVDSYDAEARESRMMFNDFTQDVRDLVQTGTEWDAEEWFLVSEVKLTGPDERERPTWPVEAVTPKPGKADIGCQVIDAKVAEQVRAAQAQEVTDGGIHGWRIGDQVIDVLLLPVIPGRTCDDLEPYVYPAG